MGDNQRQEKVVRKEVKGQLGSLSPLKILDNWLKLALKLSSVRKDNTWFMVLSSCYNNKVSSRVVLLKELSPRNEVIFYSNYLSDKAKQIDKNPFVALNLYWPELNKQVRIEGKLYKTSRQKSIQYWKSRSRQSQVSQWLSKQSSHLSSQKELLKLQQQTEERFKNKPIPCPAHWGGYRLKIKKIEFWLNGKNRLHDRFLFEKNKNSWDLKRLFP